MSEISKFEALEQKITRAIEKVASLKIENKDLQAQLKQANAKNSALKKEMSGAKTASAKNNSPDFGKLRGKVDSLLQKIDALEL